MSDIKAKYPSEPLKIWNKAKQLRLKVYEDYAKAKERGELRVAGSAWAFHAITAGLGKDVHWLTGEPYGASVGYNVPFSLRCTEATAKAGFDRTLCAYLRNYIGSILLNEYNWPEWSKEWPKSDFIFTIHTCCSHAKWYQIASKLEKSPMFAIDVTVGPALYPPYYELEDYKVDYVVNQIKDAIVWMEKITGRSFNDNAMIDAMWNEMRSCSLWAEICCLNKAVPAPLDEKTMLSLYVINTLGIEWRDDVVKFYEELLDEVKDRVKRGVAAVPNERIRIITDQVPPWSMLEIYREMEKYGVVSLGSVYTFGLCGYFEIKEDGTLGPKTVPQKTYNVDEALRRYVEYKLARPGWQHVYGSEIKSDLMLRIAREWKVDGVLFHFNRGCELWCLGAAENRLAMLKAGYTVGVYEGNHADEREVDRAAIMNKIYAFLESLGAKVSK